MKLKKARLLQLAELLERDANNEKGIQFDLEPVFRKSDGSNYAYRERPKYDCSTTGCAIGLWALSGEFKGVRMKRSDDGEFWPAYAGLDGLEAAEHYFGLTDDQGSYLFLPHSYEMDNLPTKGRAGELACAKRIRDLVAGAD